MKFHQDNNIGSFSRHGNGDINEYLAKIIGKKFVEYRQLWEQVHNFKIFPEFPLYISLEFERKCNLKCTFCSMADGEKNTSGYYSDQMSDQLFSKIIEEIKDNYCPSMGFNVLNEPLLNKKIYNRIKIAHNSGIIDSRINTNATSLNTTNSKKLIDSGLTRLSVSLDAFNKETYENSRIGSNYEKVIKNIENFLNVREKLNSKLPILRVTFVKLENNINELENFYNFWIKRADQISIQSFINPIFTNDSDRSFDEDSTCPQPNERLIIMGNGDVAPCCSQYNNLLKMGNIKTNSIKNIFSSKNYTELRHTMKEKTWYKNETF